MSENTEQLIKELEEAKDLLARFLAKRVKDEADKDFYSYREIVDEERLKKKLYRLFLNRIDPADREILLGLDREIDAITDHIYKDSGWYRTPYGFCFETNLLNVHDSEFKTQNTFMVGRTEEGYTCAHTDPFNNYSVYINEFERRFCEKYKIELNRLHNFLTKKEKMMQGEYEVKNEEDRDLLKYISIYLGFKEKRVVNEKQEQRVKTL